MTEENKTEVQAEVPTKFKSLVEGIEKMTVVELHELVKFLEGRFGVSAQAMMAPAASGAGAAAVEEKTEFKVKLTAAGEQKIQVIKVIKEVLGLGLKESKDLVEAAPSMLKEGLKKEEAEDLKKKIEAAGGKVALE
ncbi:MAG: 50S ribosomal protein L7/L12 [Patescibacteria group bacterium]